jgi:hypothetical protein
MQYFCTGAMGVSNAFYGTKLLLNADVPDVDDYKKKYIYYYIRHITYCCINSFSDIDFNYNLQKIHRLNETDVALTQVVSQMIGLSLVTVADDLIQTQRMTIEDLIESTEVILYVSMHV